MPRARWRKIIFLLTLSSLFSAAGLSAQDQCELLVLPDSPAGRSFVYLLDNNGEHFLEARVDEELNPRPSTNLELMKTLARSHEDCKKDYLGPDVQANADWANSFAQHFRFLGEDNMLQIVDTVRFTKDSAPLSTFLSRLNLNQSWQAILTNYNKVGDPEWNSLPPRLLRIPRNERTLKVVRVKNDDVKSARGTSEKEFIAATVLANLKKRGIEGLHIASFVVNTPATATTTTTTTTEPVSSTTTDPAQPAILSERTEQWLVLTIGLLFGLAVAFASRRLIELWTLSQHARGTRLAGFINQINPFHDEQAKTREDVERILREQSKTLVEMAKALDEAAGEGDEEKLVQQGQLVAPEGKELNSKINELLHRLKDLSRAGEDRAWSEAVGKLHTLNRKHQLSTDEPPTKDQSVFHQLVGIPFQIVASVKQMIEGRADVGESATLQVRLDTYRRLLAADLEAYEQTEMDLSNLLDSRSGTPADAAAQAEPSQSPLEDRFDQFFRSVVDPLRVDAKQVNTLLDQRGAPADAELSTRVETYLDAFESSMRSVKEFFGAGEDIETRQFAIAQLEESAGSIQLLQEAAAHAVVDLETAAQKRVNEAEVSASLNKASQALTRYHVANITEREISPPPDSTSTLELADHLHRELTELVSDAEKNRQSKFFSVILNLAMKGNVHLNQGISSWRSTRGNRLMLDYLATGLDKLNLYALELLGSDQLKPIDAANLLSGTRDHPGQLLSILRILAWIQTLRAYTGIWEAMRPDAQDGFSKADHDLRNLLKRLGIKPHTFELFGDPRDLRIPNKPAESKIVIEEPEFRAELGRLHRKQKIAANEVVIEVRQLGFEVDPEGFSALRQQDSPTYLCITKIDLIERYALETA